MDLEEIILSLPTHIFAGDGNASPLCLRFRPQISKWTFGYGNKSGINKNERHGLGDSPMDAVADFIKKAKAYGKK